MGLGTLQRRIMLELGLSSEPMSNDRLHNKTGAQPKSINRALNGLINSDLVKRGTTIGGGDLRWSYVYSLVTPPDHSWREKAIETATERLTAAGAEPLDILSLQTLIDSNPEVFVEIAAIIDGARHNEA